MRSNKLKIAIAAVIAFASIGGDLIMSLTM